MDIIITFLGWGIGGKHPLTSPTPYFFKLNYQNLITFFRKKSNAKKLRAGSGSHILHNNKKNIEIMQYTAANIFTS